MNKILKFLLYFIVVISLIAINSCSSSVDEFAGEWEITINWDNNSGSTTINITFDGCNSAGTVYINGIVVGSYQIVDNGSYKEIQFSYSISQLYNVSSNEVNGGMYYYEYNGSLTDWENMSGVVDAYVDSTATYDKRVDARVLIKSGTWKGKKKRTH